MSELIDPVANLKFYQNRGSRLSDEAKAFSGFLKMYIARWAGSSRVQSRRPRMPPAAEDASYFN